MATVQSAFSRMDAGFFSDASILGVLPTPCARNHDGFILHPFAQFDVPRADDPGLTALLGARRADGRTFDEFFQTSDWEDLFKSPPTLLRAFRVMDRLFDVKWGTPSGKCTVEMLKYLTKVRL